MRRQLVERPLVISREISCFNVSLESAFLCQEGEFIPLYGVSMAMHIDEINFYNLPLLCLCVLVRLTLFNIQKECSCLQSMPEYYFSAIISCICLIMKI